MISKGTHPAVATDIQWGTAGQDNKKQIAVTFRILEGEDQGLNITWFGYFTAKTYERTCEALRYCGWRGNQLDDLGTLDQKVQIVVEHEEYEGKNRAKVAWVNAFGSGGVKLKNPMSDDEIRNFAAMMRERVSVIKEVEGERIENNSPPPPSDFSDGSPPPIEGDIPF